MGTLHYLLLLCASAGQAESPLEWNRTTWRLTRSEHGGLSVKMRIGIDMRLYDMLVDLRSKWTWVTRCGVMKRMNNCFYDGLTESKMLHEKADFSFSQGTATGDLYLGHFFPRRQLDFEVLSHTFVAVNNISFFDPEMKGTPKLEGVLGLAFDSRSDDERIFLENLNIEKVVAHKLFAVYVSRSPDQDSSLTLGYSDVPRYFTGGYTNNVTVSETAYWGVTLSHFYVNAIPVPVSTSVAIFDLASQFLVIPEADFQNIILMVTKDHSNCGSWYGKMVNCSCASVNEFPTLTFTLGSTNFDLLPEVYINRTESCNILIQPRDFEGEFVKEYRDLGNRAVWLLGEVFFSAFYMVFDMDNKVVSIAGGPAPLEQLSDSPTKLPNLKVKAVMWLLCGAAATAAAIGLYCYCRSRKLRAEVPYKLEHSFELSQPRDERKPASNRFSTTS